MEKKFDIFFSHATEDKEIALSLCEYLEQRKLRCWIAARDNMGGSNYAQSILRAIESSHIILVVLSEHANQSPFVQNEVERAFSKKLKKLPFIIDGCEPLESLEFFLGSTHWLRAKKQEPLASFPEVYKNCIAILNQDLFSSLLPTPPEKSPVQPVPPVPPTPVPPAPEPLPEPIPLPPPKPEPVQLQPKMFQNIFSFNGRIRRTEYGLSLLIYCVIYFLLYLIVRLKVRYLYSYDKEPSATEIISFIITAVIAAWFLLAQGAKRCHDFSKSGWYQLIPFFSFVLPFIDGEPNANEYGQNPKRIQLSSAVTAKQGVKPAIPIIAGSISLLLLIISPPKKSGSDYDYKSATADTTVSMAPAYDSSHVAVDSARISSAINFFDDFSDNSNYWPLKYDDNKIISISDGGLQIQGLTDSFSYRAHKIFSFNTDNNFMLSTSAKWIKGTNAAPFGIDFLSDAENLSYNSFLVSADGEYTIKNIYANETWQDLVAWTKSDFVKQGQQTNSLTIIKKGDTFYFYVNDKYVEVLYSDKVKKYGNSFGLRVFENQTVSFDYFSLKTIE
ncbi:MAG TPA: TIR domain-containing protein [Chitinophagaceae bacterium]|nr:TIR domain-containing protein [Chitinophagaceae bacterium]